MKYAGIYAYPGLHHVEDGESEYLVWRAADGLDHKDQNRSWKSVDGYVVIEKDEHFWRNVEDRETRRRVVLTAWPMVDEALPEFPK